MEPMQTRKTGDYTNNPRQDPRELIEFLKFVEQVAPKSYLEIGCQFGGLFWQVVRKMAKGSRAYAIDLPTGPWGRGDSARSLQDCIAHLNREGYSTDLLLADSTLPATVNWARQLGPFDLIFIDANHTEKYVRADWANYHNMGKIICFHDIGWVAPVPPRAGKLPIEVPKVWAELKAKFKDQADFREIKLDPTPPGHNGIGILTWHQAGP